MESYESILKRMQTKFEEEAGFSADDASDVGIRLKVLSGEIYSAMSNLEWIKREMFPQTASLGQLDKHAEQRGLKRKSAVNSKGKLKFSINEASDSDISIPKGTICATSGVNSIRFITLDDAVISAGNLYAEVTAQSEEAGKASNANSGTVTIMVTFVQGVDSVTNASAFTGGADEETDEELRKRLIESYRNVSNGTNVAFYKDFVLQYDGVNSASVEKLARGTGTLDVYVCGKGAQVSASLLSQINSDIQKVREINIDVDVVNAELVSVNVYFSLAVESGYDKTSVQNACKQAIKDYFLTLGIGDGVYLSAVSNVIYGVEGVKNYRFSASGNADVTIPSNKQAICGTITITDM